MVAVNLTDADPKVLGAAESEPWPSPRVAWYAVVVFAITLTFARIDPGVMNLLVQPIKRDLGLSDTKMGLLLGPAFVIFYTFIGLPLSRLVDRINRKRIMACGIAAWSLATACCGLAQNFVQLFLARVGIGAGESINGPATYSMIADFFPRQKLPRAIAVMHLGYIAGGGLSILIGAFVIQIVLGVPDFTLPVIGTIRNWQLVFLAVGLPGLGVALLMLTVPEPKRRGLRLGEARTRVPLRDVVRYLLRHWPVYAPMYVGLGVSAVNTFGADAWLAAFFQRTYGWSAPQFGMWYGISSLAASPVGLLIGIWLNERYHRRGQDDANIRVLLMGLALRVPAAILAPLMPTPALALACVALNGFAQSIGVPSQNAALQTVTPNEMRGQVTALYLFAFSVVGQGLGPLWIALITDHVLGSEALLRYSLVISAALLAPLSAIILGLGLRPYGRAVAAIRAAEG